jgi:hypothetical protein
MSPKSAEDAAAYGILLSEKLTAANLLVNYADLETGRWEKWLPPEYSDGSKKRSRRGEHPRV